MRALFFLFIATSTLFSLNLSDTLPKETSQIINSFDCFDKDDKVILSTYTLALKYRMEHVDDIDALTKSDLSYWRLWHLTYDIVHECALGYHFGKILEKTITPTDKEKKTLKKLRRVEGGIHTEGSSESSAKMSKYDAKLRKLILLKPPKYKVLEKNKQLQDYNLSSLKHYTQASIPQNVYDWIKKQKLLKNQENILFRYAFLEEEMIRKYDKPKKRHKIKQEMLYLKECQKFYKIHLGGNFYPTFKRKLANESITQNNYHPLKTEFLPKETQQYCENNITNMKLTTFILKKEKKTPKKVLQIDFKNTKKIIKNYKGDALIQEKMKTYLSIVEYQLKHKSKDLIKGLKLVRLTNCFKDKNTKFLTTLAQDIEKNKLKEEFKETVLQSQLWWIMTIGMKISSEGESKELKSFFDCNQTALSMKKTDKTTSYADTTKVGELIEQRDSILKYYAKVFENTPTTNLNNKKAIEAGIVAKKWINKEGDIFTPLGDSINITGMPKGGIKLTYSGIPKGKSCSQLLQFNRSDIIHFDGQRYSGLDFIMINKHKIKINHYVHKYVERVCNKVDNNVSISFVKESTVKKHTFNHDKLVDSSFNNVQKINSIDNNKHNPHSFAHVKGENTFVAIGGESKLYSIKHQALIKKLPKKLNHSYNIALSPNGEYLAVERYGTNIHIWNMQKNQLVKTIKISSKGIGQPKIFLSDNKTLLLSGEKIHFLNIETEEITTEIAPKFMHSKRKYNNNRINTIVESPDGNTLYIGSNKNKIERWNIKKPLFTSLKASYIDYIEDKEIREIGALTFDNKDNNILIVGSSNVKINFWNVKEKKLIKTYTADEYMGCNNITFSDDNQYMLATGSHSAFLWALNNTEQYDIINGNKILGGIFLPNSHDFITIDKKVSIWRIKVKK